MLKFKMHISREPLILGQQMSSFDKKHFINQDFIHGYCEVFNMA